MLAGVWASTMAMMSCEWNVPLGRLSAVRWKQKGDKEITTSVLAQHQEERTISPNEGDLIPIKLFVLVKSNNRSVGDAAGVRKCGYWPTTQITHLCARSGWGEHVWNKVDQSCWSQSFRGIHWHHITAMLHASAKLCTPSGQNERKKIHVFSFIDVSKLIIIIKNGGTVV